MSSVCLSEGRLDRLIFGFVKKKNKQTTIGQTVQNFKITLSNAVSDKFLRVPSQERFLDFKSIYFVSWSDPAAQTA